MVRPPKVEKHKINTLQQWVVEAQFASAEWRQRSWRACELYDGGQSQWNAEDWAKAEENGIDPITVNRVFPTTNVILGSQVLTKHSIIAKGRTQEDSETGQVMSEGIQFVMDQWDGEFLVSMAFRDQTIPGFGCLGVTLSNDPRQEKIKVVYRSWMEIDWDPFGSPWFDPSKTRYVFYHRWMDLDDLKSMYWEKKKDLDEAFNQYSQSSHFSSYGPFGWDEATLVEDYRRVYSGGYWADKVRQRVRPVEMWYRLFEWGHWAVFPDGRAVELNPERMSGSDMFQAVRKSQEIVQAVVPHIYVCTFLGDLELHHDRSPFNHDIYPMVPFIGYIDRYNCPYGVPTQVEGQQEEVNKRRSMALALLQKRRLAVESDVVKGGEEEIDLLYREANKLDGLMIVRPGKLQGLKFMEDHELFPAHVNLMDRSATEIQEISGANAELSGYESNARSGVAIDKRMQQSATVIAPLFDNLRRSQKILGYQVGSNMQQLWTREKVLRVTDRLTGADRFVALNQIVDQGGGSVTIKNDITQGKYDYIVTEIPRTDTIREMYLNMIIEWVKRTPPEAVPILLTVAFEIADLPNKEKILSKIKPLLGADPRDEQMDPEQLKQKAIQELEGQRQMAAEAAKLEKQGIELEQRKVKLEGDQIMARIKEIDERLKIERARAVSEIRTAGKEKAAPAKEKPDPALQTSLDLVKARQSTDLKKEEMATQASLDMVKEKQASGLRKEEAEHGSKLNKDEEKTKATSVLKQRQEDSKLKIKEEKAKPKPQAKPAAKNKGK